MRPRKIYAVYEYAEDYHEIRFMFYEKDTAESCAELLRKQQDLNNHIEAQLEEFGVERVYKDDSTFIVEEWEIADGDYEHETD